MKAKSKDLKQESRNSKKLYSCKESKKIRSVLTSAEVIEQIAYPSPTKQLLDL